MTQRVPTEQLVAMLKSARQRTLELVAVLSPDQWIGPRLATVNPPQWEIGHVGWFQEYFALRRVHGCAPLLERGDALYDSIAIAHDRRWDLPLYTIEETLDYLVRLRDRMIERLEGGLASEEDSFNYAFTTFHEDMHDEAFLWTWQALGYATPVFQPDGPPRSGESCTGAGALSGDAKIPGGTFQLGSSPDAPFLFDNEKWAHPVSVAPFRMARAPVTNVEFQAFVEEGGYTRQEWWDEQGWAWRRKTGALHPVYWRWDGSGRWQVRRFDAWHDLAPHQPVIHVCWYEANAYCRWAGASRRKRSGNLRRACGRPLAASSARHSIRGAMMLPPRRTRTSTASRSDASTWPRIPRATARSGCGSSSATSGSGRKTPSLPSRGSRRMPTRSTPSRSLARRRFCAEGRGRRVRG
jgi:iron(II)-dependent oxidoreductase